MVSVLYRLFLTVLLVSWLGSAGAVSLSTAAAENGVPSARFDSSFPTPRFSSSVPLTHSTSLSQKPRAGDKDLLNPFGFLGNQPGEMTTAESSSEKAPILTIVSSSKAGVKSSSSSTSSTSSAASASLVNPTSHNIIGTPGQSPNTAPSVFVSSASISFAIPTQTAVSAAKQSGNATSSANSNMSSWRIVGFGVLATAGIVLLILGFAFHDSWWDGCLRPKCLGKTHNLEEQLIPDWDRRSWRFGIESKEGADRYPSIGSFPSTFKVNSTKTKYLDEATPWQDEKFRQGDANSNLQFPLPPEAPFPLHRTPSSISKVTADTYASPNEQNTQHPIVLPPLPPPPPALSPGRNSLNAIGLPSVWPQFSSAETDAKESDRKRYSRASISVRNSVYESDVYGGIEESTRH